MVPTTAWTPAARQARTLSSAVSGVREVDDDVGLAEHVGELDPERRVGRAASSMSSAPSTASQTVCAHPPGGARDDDPDHAATRASLTGASAVRKRSSSRPTQAAESRSAP